MTNRLAEELSPYLRAHADNPVDWYPWGAEAFAEARRRDVPILLSIGYATCHWCHVMARESFSDPALAERLNRRFVAVKVDREEHPDVDATYLAAAAGFTRQLGWPLTVFLTPEGQAFYAGTYFPPTPSRGLPALSQVLDAVWHAWKGDRKQVSETAARLAANLGQLAGRAAPSGDALRRADVGALVDAAAEQALGREDEEHGGFGAAPKFPLAPALDFLIEAGSTPDAVGPGDSAAGVSGRAAALRALRAMAGSDLRDPVEGGFFRYATMADWSVPHYERMLYDNAQLLSLYTHAVAGARNGDAVDDFDSAASGIAGFLIDVLGREGGGFGSAQDSESIVHGERSEGGYYALDAAGRSRETPPPVDGKVLAGWNGLAIAALADAGVTFARPEWVGAARAAADRILATHRTEEGRLARASLDGVVSRAPATLEDYGLFSVGLLRLALAGGGARYAEAARRLVDTVLSGPGHEDTAKRPFTPPEAADPLLAAQGVEVLETEGGSTLPGGEVACAWAAHLLGQMTAEERYDLVAGRVVSARLESAAAEPLAAGDVLALAARRLSRRQIVVVLPDHDVPGGPSAAIVAAALRLTGVHAVVSESESRALAAAGFTLFESRDCREGVPTVYVCHDFVCELPITDPSLLGVS